MKRDRIGRGRETGQGEVERQVSLEERLGRKEGRENSIGKGREKETGKDATKLAKREGGNNRAKDHKKEKKCSIK